MVRRSQQEAAWGVGRAAPPRPLPVRARAAGSSPSLAPAKRARTPRTRFHEAECNISRCDSTSARSAKLRTEWRFASYRAALESHNIFLILSGKDVVRAPLSTFCEGRSA